MNVPAFWMHKCTCHFIFEPDGTAVLAYIFSFSTMEGFHLRISTSLHYSSILVALFHQARTPHLVTSRPSKTFTMSPTDRITIVSKSLSDASLASTPTAFAPSSVPDSYFAELPQPLLVRLRNRYRFFFSELTGTFVFLLFAFGVSAQVTLSEGTKGDWTTLCLGWGYVPPSPLPSQAPTNNRAG